MDTCGHERFDALCEKYYKNGDGVLLVFDITNKKSFEKIEKYYVDKIKEKCKKEIPIILLGNKIDLEEGRVVSREEAIDLSINNEYIYKETSCVKNENVADAFETIIIMTNNDMIKIGKQNFETKIALEPFKFEENNTIKLEQSKTNKNKKKNCC